MTAVSSGIVPGRSVTGSALPMRADMSLVPGAADVSDGSALATMRCLQLSHRPKPAFACSAKPSQTTSATASESSRW